MIMPAVMNIIPPMTDAMISKVKKLDAWSFKRAQINLPVDHFLHAGMYTRTINIPAGVMITGAHIVLETTLVIKGHCFIHNGIEWLEYYGYSIQPCAANRKQIFVAISDVDLTMFFPTAAKTVKEAEEQFTNEYHLLQNRR